MEQLEVKTPGSLYKIQIGADLWERVKTIAGEYGKVLVVSDSNVHALYGHHLPFESIVLPPGEEQKTPATIVRLAEELARRGFDRHSLVVALGGGVVGDLAGFAASIYLRGIAYLQVPTTLLAQVDSSVGGKTGVNLPQGKNLLGSFYQPRAVFADLTTLRTLSKREITTGLAEVFKYGIIKDRSLFEFTSTHLAQVYQADLGILQTIVQRCVQLKAEIVGADEKDLGLRKILNHGHTLGHALEAATNYRVYSHGEAVFLGMLGEACLSSELGILPHSHYQEIESVLKQIDLEWSWPNLSPHKLLEGMLRDKKNREGRISFILPREIGAVQEVFLSPAQVEDYLERVLVKR